MNTKPKCRKISDRLIEYQYNDAEKTLLLCTPVNGEPHMLFGFKQTDEGVKTAQVQAENLPKGFQEEVWIDAQLWFAEKLAELSPSDEIDNWE